jgi:hypothetical protein
MLDFEEKQKPSNPSVKYSIFLPYMGLIRNTWKVLKCDAGEGWRRSVGPIMREMKK